MLGRGHPLAPDSRSLAGPGALRAHVGTCGPPRARRAPISPLSWEFLLKAKQTKNALVLPEFLPVAKRVSSQLPGASGSGEPLPLPAWVQPPWARHWPPLGSRLPCLAAGSVWGWPQQSSLPGGGGNAKFPVGREGRAFRGEDATLPNLRSKPQGNQGDRRLCCLAVSPSLRVWAGVSLGKQDGGKERHWRSAPTASAQHKASVIRLPQRRGAPQAPRPQEAPEPDTLESWSERRGDETLAGRGMQRSHIPLGLLVAAGGPLEASRLPLALWLLGVEILSALLLLVQ